MPEVSEDEADEVNGVADAGAAASGPEIYL